MKERAGQQEVKHIVRNMLSNTEHQKQHPYGYILGMTETALVSLRDTDEITRDQ